MYDWVSFRHIALRFVKTILKSCFSAFHKRGKLLHYFITSKLFELQSCDCAQIEGIFKTLTNLKVFSKSVLGKRRYNGKYDCHSYELDSNVVAIVFYLNCNELIANTLSLIAGPALQCTRPQSQATKKFN